MSKVLDSRLCNESGMMFEFDTNEMGRSEDHTRAAHAASHSAL
jgi:hypothetical protein